MGKGVTASPLPLGFGGKARVSPIVWDAFGNVPNYGEPFYGSGANLLGRPHPPGTETINDIDGYVCVAPQTKVCTLDLLWKRAGDVNVGDRLLAFDEKNGPARVGLRAPTSYRRWSKATVSGVSRVIKPSYRLKFDDGTELIASEDHMFLGGSHKSGGRGWRWQSVKGMIANRKEQRSWILKLLPVVDPIDTWDAGWLGGFCDGEANISGGPGWRVSIHQKDGIEMNRAGNILVENGFKYTRYTRAGFTPKGRQSEIDVIVINGGMSEILRFLQTFQPSRLIRNCISKLESRSIYGRDHHAVGLVEKEFIGDHEVIAIETDTHTFVAEGLASHNCNFWRSIKHAPDEVAEWCDWPVNENDLHARHAWLVERKAGFTARLEGDPDYYDAKVAGWWVWGICSWIGGGWCSGNGPWQSVDGKLVKVSGGAGVKRVMPHLFRPQGINRQIPNIGDYGKGINGRSKPPVHDWFAALSARLRNVRVCCGDWSRICGPSPTTHLGLTGVFLDPPYSAEAGRCDDVYASDDLTVAHDVRRWCLENGDNKLLRIALCGYDGEHDGLTAAGWRVHAWKAHGGYGGGMGGIGDANSHRERIWFSPHCLDNRVRGLFG